MGILAGFIRQFRTWDLASRISFVMALILFWLALGVLSFGPDAIRDYALAGVVGLLLVMQLIVLWGNRTMVTPYTQAQRHYMAGEFQAARDVLEASIEEMGHARKKTSSETLTLLGNVYRQLGDLTKSQQLLRDALKISPKSHFSHYGFGRTLLAQGDYAAAVDHIQQAIALGAPPVIEFDLGHAYVRLGEREAAVTALQNALDHTDETHRRLMALFWLHQMGLSEQPDVDLIQAGLPFWQQEAHQFAKTPYGRQLKSDIDLLTPYID
ncbi:tetratricopeptide repeat protein [Phototrophicus methaneseepsis]|uniref:Tetratricopeptide repeat protein n=1 Tax=Phototrophicus methaneseepsis TaxID=2710758 RepID=A0A7S8ICN9_9CHLR|nr:tetratricopeptide repeat protein [Phototrophicus methaneseepsis]QPC80727.1 tetratricopeptide repeat protein [Phototrophicus methaneseepsis]